MERESQMLQEQTNREMQMQRDATAYQNEIQQQQADWNKNQLEQQARNVQSVAQENMRRERENNSKELARRRASAARGGLAETGAVADSLIEASEMHQTELDDIWKRATDIEQQMLGDAAMTMWESAVGIKGRNMQTKNSNEALGLRTKNSRWQIASNIGNIQTSISNNKSAAKMDMWTTGISGATSVYKTGVKKGLWGGNSTWNAPRAYTVD